MGGQTLVWLGLAMALFVAEAGVAQDRGDRRTNPEQKEPSTRATTEVPEVPAQRPPAQPRNAAPAAASGPLQRIKTTALSASANIALPQDI